MAIRFGFGMGPSDQTKRRSMTRLMLIILQTHNPFGAKRLQAYCVLWMDT
ncbi:hypothetical protein HanPI659440_Chr02g0083431 [Helianthus annuus]|nr:hypothetical protein HanPI659440_Chr02g0083431 [Helianthus annuus]